MLRVLSVLLLSFCLVPVTQATTLKIATIAPDGTSWMKLLREAATEIKQETQGRLKLRLYPGGVMGNDRSVLRKIRVGQLHGGAITGGGLTTIYPDAEIYSLPFQFRSLSEVDYVRQSLDQAIMDGIRAKGFISYGLSEGGFAYLMSNQPVRVTDDLKGLKIWIPEGDAISAAAFQSLGVSPIPLPLTDVLTGLQTGLVDTVVASSVGAVALQWHTRVKYLTQVPLVYLYGSLIIKQSALNKISAEDRIILKRTLESAFAKLNRQSRIDETGALQALQQQGIEFIEPNQKERLAWEKHAASTIANLSDDHPFSAELLQQMQELIRSHRQAQKE